MRHLSRYLLGAADRRALRWTDSYSLHRIIYDLFDDVRGNDRQRGSGILFADKGVRQGVSRVIILSDRLPRTPQRGVLETQPFGPKVSCRRLLSVRGRREPCLARQPQRQDHARTRA